MKAVTLMVAAVLGLMLLNGAIEYLASVARLSTVAVLFLISTVLGICIGTALRVLDGPR